MADKNTDDGLFNSIQDEKLIVNETRKQIYIEIVALVVPCFAGSLLYFESMINHISVFFGYSWWTKIYFET